MRPLALLAPVFVTACATASDSADSADTGDTADTGDVGVAVVELSFAMDPDLIAEMAEAPVGTFHGSIFAEADATGFGPNEGAVALVDFESGALDLSVEGGPSAVAYTTELAPQVVWILGCLDSDVNDCECGDPITHPNDNKVQVVAGANPLTVQMELLHPCD